SNGMKVRFLYMRYVIKQIKKGFRFKNCDTARQVETKLATDESRPLFTLYECARYAQREHITDDEVEYCKKLK
ncbi:MAG TPA: hypothetical protein PLT66_06015, partial [Bacillota bacterium]|nr:hypothetical protein [Bacillota bacterium]